MPGPRKQIVYLISACAVVVLGLASRQYGGFLPTFLAPYAGDILWALMVFLLVSALASHARMPTRAAAAVVVSYLVEVSQLYHAPWIDSLRDTRLGGLILGFGFLWSDLACYAGGVALGSVLETAVRRLTSDDH